MGWLRLESWCLGYGCRAPCTRVGLGWCCTWGSRDSHWAVVPEWGRRYEDHLYLACWSLPKPASFRTGDAPILQSRSPVGRDIYPVLQLLWSVHSSTKCLLAVQNVFGTITFNRKYPCFPKGSWLIAMTCLFCKRSLDFGSIALRSFDISNGAAMIAHKAIWVTCWSKLSPKFPKTSWWKIKSYCVVESTADTWTGVLRSTQSDATMSGSFQPPGPAAGTMIFWCFAAQSVMAVTLAQESKMSPEFLHWLQVFRMAV